MQGLEHVERCLCFLLFFAFYTGNGVDEERKRASRETEKGETAQSRNLTRVHCGKGGRGSFFSLTGMDVVFYKNERRPRFVRHNDTRGDFTRNGIFFWPDIRKKDRLNKNHHTTFFFFLLTAFLYYTSATRARQRESCYILTYFFVSFL